MCQYCRTIQLGAQTQYQGTSRFTVEFGSLPEIVRSEDFSLHFYAEFALHPSIAIRVS